VTKMEATLDRTAQCADQGMGHLEEQLAVGTLELQRQALERAAQAKAEAESLLLIAAAIKENPSILQYQYINKLAPGIQVMLVPNNAPYLLPLPTLPPQSSPASALPTPEPSSPSP